MNTVAPTQDFSFFRHLIQFYDWQRTDAYNGKFVSGQGRVWQVIDAVLVPAGWPMHDGIKAQAVVRNHDGDLAYAYVTEHEHIALI